MSLRGRQVPTKQWEGPQRPPSPGPSSCRRAGEETHRAGDHMASPPLGSATPFLAEAVSRSPSSKPLSWALLQPGAAKLTGEVPTSLTSEVWGGRG